MSQPQNPPIKLGDVLIVKEPGYMYGTSVLILRVTKVGRVQQVHDGHWLDLEGLTLRPDGTQMSTEPRHALVRLSAIRGGIQRQQGAS